MALFVICTLTLRQVFTVAVNERGQLSRLPREVANQEAMAGKAEKWKTRQENSRNGNQCLIRDNSPTE